MKLKSLYNSIYESLFDTDDGSFTAAETEAMNLLSFMGSGIFELWHAPREKINKYIEDGEICYEDKTFKFVSNNTACPTIMHVDNGEKKVKDYFNDIKKIYINGYTDIEFRGDDINSDNVCDEVYCYGSIFVVASKSISGMNFETGEYISIKRSTFDSNKNFNNSIVHISNCDFTSKEYLYINSPRPIMHNVTVDASCIYFAARDKYGNKKSDFSPVLEFIDGDFDSVYDSYAKDDKPITGTLQVKNVNLSDTLLKGIKCKSNYVALENHDENIVTVVASRQELKQIGWDRYKIRCNNRTIAKYLIGITKDKWYIYVLPSSIIK